MSAANKQNSRILSSYELLSARFILFQLSTFLIIPAPVLQTEIVVEGIQSCGVIGCNLLFRAFEYYQTANANVLRATASPCSPFLLQGLQYEIDKLNSRSSG